MASFESDKGSLEYDGCDGAVGPLELSVCALAMREEEKEREMVPSPFDGPNTFSSNANTSLQGIAPLQGYDVEFDPPLESKYECPICLMALRSAVQTPCGHRFCKNCIEKSIRDTGQRCPVDNEILLEEQLFPDNFAKREILSLTVRCPNTGCNNKMELRRLESHITQCPFEMVPCPQCQESVWKSQLEEHISVQCPRRTVSCPDCVASFVFEDTKLHEQQCPFASVTCQYCGMELIRDQMECHCDADCPKVPIACTFSAFGCRERMQRHDLAQHMQEFTQMHLRSMADFIVRNLGLNGTTPLPSLWPSSSSSPCCPSSSSYEDRGAAASVSSTGGTRTAASCSVSSAPCQHNNEVQRLKEVTQQLEGRLVLQDQQLLELKIHKETQKGINATQERQLTELRQKVASLEETARELEAQQFQGVFVWRLRNFSAHLRTQGGGQPVVEHSPGFYTGRPGYKLCLRLHIQTAAAPRCSNYISLFVHIMQGNSDGQLSWPFQATIRLAILDQGPEGQHHEEVMETKPDLQAFQKPTIQRNPKGFGYVTFLHLTQLQHRAFVKDDTMLVRCEVTPRLNGALRREGALAQPRGAESSM
ncbi:TNF receptor-associated factor 6 [Aplochiton taeniatus]